MGGYGLPALDVRPPAPQNPLAQLGDLFRMRQEQQQLQAGQQEMQARQLEIQ